MNKAEETMHAAYSHKQWLFAYAYSITKDPHASNDIVQEVFSKLLRQPEGKVDLNLTGWLSIVCKHTALKHIDKRKRYTYILEITPGIGHQKYALPELTVDSHVEDIIFTEMTTERMEKLNAALKQLRPRLKKVIQLRFFSGLSYADAAKEMNTSTGNIGFMINAAVKQLKQKMLK